MSKISKLMLALIFFGIFAFYFIIKFVPFPFSEQKLIELNNWSYQWVESFADHDAIDVWLEESKKESGGWTTINSPFNPEGRKDQYELWLKLKIPQGTWRDPSIKIQVHQGFEIYTMDGMFYKYGDFSYTPSKIPGTITKLVSLPMEALGDNVYIRVYSNSSKIGVTGKTILGDKSDIMLNEFIRNLDELIFGSFYIMIGVIFLYSFFVFRNQKLFISFAIISIWMGIFNISRMTVVYYLYDHTLFWTYLNMISLVFSFVGFIMLIEYMFGAGIWKFIRRMWQLHLIYCLAAVTLIITGAASFSNMMTGYLIVILITMVINCLTIYCEVKKGQREAKLIMFGSFMISMAGASEIIERLSGIESNWSIMMSFGMTIFFLMILIQLMKRVMELMLVARNSEKLSMVSQMAAGVAHEIRNPISVISGFVQLIKQDPNNVRFLDLISSEIERMDGIVSDFLLLSRPTKETMTYWHIHVIMQDTLELFKAQMNDKQIGLEILMDQDLPMIKCEANQLKQVFINIIKNAIESMKAGDKLVVKIQRENRNHIRIRIVDQGIGISPKEMQNLGQPFYTTKEQGTGLGLMICVRFIEYHGGTLKFQSKVNEGTTVDILLPIQSKALSNSGMTY